MSYIEISNLDYGFADPIALRQKGLELADQYRSAQPYPHIVIDDFVTPAVLDACLADFPVKPKPDSDSFNRAQERFKTSYNPDHLTPRVRSFFYALNSRPMLDFLSNMTGFKGLLPDPHFVGGGFHETSQGGHLNVHADFNLHPLLQIERRLNIILYLNRDWRLEYGGALELWDREMKACVKQIEPVFNRCVVFSTDATSYHGHPVPVQHPQGMPRRSIALYYYTATWDGTRRAFTSQFKRRRNTQDRPDWQVRAYELIDDLTPPILSRSLLNLARRLQRPSN